MSDGTRGERARERGGLLFVVWFFAVHLKQGSFAYPACVALAWLWVTLAPHRCLAVLRGFRLTSVLEQREQYLAALAVPRDPGVLPYRSGAVSALPVVTRRQVIHKDADGNVVELSAPGGRGVASLVATGRGLWVFEVRGDDQGMHVRAFRLGPRAAAFLLATPGLAALVNLEHAWIAAVVSVVATVGAVFVLPSTAAIDAEFATLVRALEAHALSGAPAPAVARRTGRSG